MTIATALLLPDDPTTVYRVPILSILVGLSAAAAWGAVWVWHLIGMGRPLRLSGWLKFFRR